MRRTLHDIATLAARLGVGGIFIGRGWSKLQAGLDDVGGEFTTLDVPVPALWSAVVALIELVGGALLIAGFAVPIAGIVLFFETFALFLLIDGRGGGLTLLTGGNIELIVALGAAAMLLATAGAGRASLDYLIVIRRRDNDAAAEMEAAGAISDFRYGVRGPASDLDDEDEFSDLREPEPVPEPVPVEPEPAPTQPKSARNKPAPPAEQPGDPTDQDTVPHRRPPVPDVLVAGESKPATRRKPKPKSS
ncbi:DoxX family protein [Rhizohabitans arisaemae]|uniref:DoxX family protein n=1 Tax=Rhizohabitans arisaemae TaxID=2720610 RepID=UPI0024B0B60F|nr:DoxX family protein [Rhizohabitans arisaemae]